VGATDSPEPPTSSGPDGASPRGRVVPLTLDADVSEAEDEGSSHSRGARVRWVLGLVAAAAAVVAGWAFGGPPSLGLSLGAPSSAASAVSSTQPVTEFAPQDRGAPVELSGTTLTGEHLDVAQLRGQPTVLNVWGSWCAPCRIEAPALKQASATYAGRASFVGIDIKDNAAAALAFEDSYGITYPSIEDPGGQAVLALSQHVPASAVPVTLILDDQGRVAARILGAAEESTLTALLDSVLAEAA
jgi:thiol-disulfide isomerase/thioredoxin